MTNTSRQTSTGITLAAVPARKDLGDYFRSERMQEVYRNRWNAYVAKQEKLAR